MYISIRFEVLRMGMEMEMGGAKASKGRKRWVKSSGRFIYFYRDELVKVGV